MLKYKQIWHGIKPTRWLIKFNLATSINMYGLIRMLGKSTKVRSAGAKPERKDCSFSTQLISQEKVLSWRLTALREIGLSGFLHRGSLRFSQRAGFHEGERESIYRCMTAVLILTLSFFLVVFFLSFPLVSFLFLSFSFQVPIS